MKSALLTVGLILCFVSLGLVESMRCGESIPKQRTDEPAPQVRKSVQHSQLDMLCYTVSFFWGKESPFNLAGKVCLLPFAMLYIAVALVLTVLMLWYGAVDTLFSATFLKHTED